MIDDALLLDYSGGYIKETFIEKEDDSNCRVKRNVDGNNDSNCLLSMNGGIVLSQKLEELGNMLTGLDAGDSIVIAKSFSHMLNLANLAEEVQIDYRRRIKLFKKGDFADENSAKAWHVCPLHTLQKHGSCFWEVY